MYSSHNNRPIGIVLSFYMYSIHLEIVVQKCHTVKILSLVNTFHLINSPLNTLLLKTKIHLI